MELHISHPVWVDTDPAGAILDWSDSAPPLLGYSPRSLRGRPLSIMIIENRPRITELMGVVRGSPIERDGVIRPTERRGVPIRYCVGVADWKFQELPVLRWTFTPRPARD